MYYLTQRLRLIKSASTSAAASDASSTTQGWNSIAPIESRRDWRRARTQLSHGEAEGNGVRGRGGERVGTSENKNGRWSWTSGFEYIPWRFCRWREICKRPKILNELAEGYEGIWKRLSALPSTAQCSWCLRTNLMVKFISFGSLMIVL